MTYMSLKYNKLKTADFNVPFPNLKRIDLSNNEISIVDMKNDNFPKLKCLILSDNKISTIREIPKSVKALYLEHCDLHHFLKNLKEFTNLHFLSLRDNKIKQVLEYPSELRILDLSFNEISSLPTDKKKLEELFLFDNPIKNIDLY